MNAEKKREGAKALKNYLLHHGPQLFPEFVNEKAHSDAERRFRSILSYNSDLEIDWELKIIHVKSVERKVFYKVYRKFDKSSRIDFLTRNLQSHKSSSLYPFLSGKSQEELERIALDYYTRADRTCVWGDRVYFDTSQRAPTTEDYFFLWPIRNFMQPTPSFRRQKPSVSDMSQSKVNISGNNSKPYLSKNFKKHNGIETNHKNACLHDDQDTSFADDEMESGYVEADVIHLYVFLRRFIQRPKFEISFLRSLLRRNPLLYVLEHDVVRQKETGFNVEFNEQNRTWKHSELNKVSAISFSERLVIQFIVNVFRKNCCSVLDLIEALAAACSPIQVHLSVQGWDVIKLIQFINTNLLSEIEFRSDEFRIKRNKEWDELCTKLVEAETHKKRQAELSMQEEDAQLTLSRPATENNVEAPVSKGGSQSLISFTKSACRPLPSQNSKQSKKGFYQPTNHQKKSKKNMHKFDKKKWNTSTHGNSGPSATDEGPIDLKINGFAFTNDWQVQRIHDRKQSKTARSINDLKNHMNRESAKDFVTNSTAKIENSDYASESLPDVPTHNMASDQQCSLPTTSGGVTLLTTQLTTESKAKNEDSDSTAERCFSLKFKSNDSFPSKFSSSFRFITPNQHTNGPVSKPTEQPRKRQVFIPEGSANPYGILHANHEPMLAATNKLNEPGNNPVGNSLPSVPVSQVRMKESQENLSTRSLSLALTLNAKSTPRSVENFPKQLGKTISSTLKVLKVERIDDNKSDVSAPPISTKVLPKTSRSEMVNPSLRQILKEFNEKNEVHINLLFLRLQIQVTFFTSIQHFHIYLSQFASALRISECWVELKNTK